MELALHFYGHGLQCKCAYLTCTTFYTQSNAGQYCATFTHGFVNNLIEMHYYTLKQYLGPVMILDPHSQKCLSHNLINDISYQNASAVTSVVQHLPISVTFSIKSINSTFPKSI